jgi:hypothetical protein
MTIDRTRSTFSAIDASDQTKDRERHDPINVSLGEVAVIGGRFACSRRITAILAV